MKDYFHLKLTNSPSALISSTKSKPLDKKISLEPQSLKESYSSKTTISAFALRKYMMIGRRQGKMESGMYSFMKESSKEKCS